MTKYLIHRCRKCRRVYIGFKVGEWKSISCPNCGLSMTQGEQGVSLKTMERRRKECPRHLT